MGTLDFRHTATALWSLSQVAGGYCAAAPVRRGRGAAAQLEGAPDQRAGADGGLQVSARRAGQRADGAAASAAG